MDKERERDSLWSLIVSGDISREGEDIILLYIDNIFIDKSTAK